MLLLSDFRVAMLDFFKYNNSKIKLRIYRNKMNFKTMKKIACLIIALPAIIAFGGGVVAGLLHKSDWWTFANIWITTRFSVLIFLLMIIAIFLETAKEIFRKINVVEFWLSVIALLVLSIIIAGMMDAPTEAINLWILSIKLIIVSLLAGVSATGATFCF